VSSTLTALRIPFDNTYARLPPRFGAPHAPAPVREPRLIRVNRPLAALLGIDADALASPVGLAMLAGNRFPEGAAPIAMAYAGHQFGNFVPQLGDGRAVLLGEVVGRDGVRRDIQLKGSGETRFSRGGDGRAAVGPVLREYLVSEAMAALGVPTTRALAAVATGEEIWREAILPGAVLTRVAASHIRVGTFQYFAARGDTEALRLLADHVIARHYPDAAGAPNPYVALLAGVTERQARLVAQWLLLGFIHGVMNTDNTTVSGETIDYGPCAFLDVYEPGKVFSSIDRTGRYAYANQPQIMLWNLSRFAETLLPLIDADEDAALEPARAALDGFAERFRAAYCGGLLRKIGLAGEAAEDVALAQDLLNRMAANQADFTVTFRRLCDAAEGDDTAVRAEFVDPAAFDAWAAPWRARLGREPAGRGDAMRAQNPAYIPRNHLVEAAIAAGLQGDFGPFEAMLAAVTTPFDERPERILYATPPLPEQRVACTFCGT
jgi:uncharacterized protein YdiU (UPF0061 family)